MERNEIINLSRKNINKKNLSDIKNILNKDFDISYGQYNYSELKKAIKNKNPFFIENNFIIGYDNNNIFINDKDEKIPIERMVKAIIIEGESEETNELVRNEPESKISFAIIGKNQWDKPLENFSVISNLRVGEVFLPPHSVVFNFLKPTEKEIKEKIVSMMSGVNINVYSPDNCIDNCFHEIGHVFWRDCLNYDEKSQFKEHAKYLKPSAIYEYDWERSSEEEVFCTVYKWYLKSILLNKSFFNILKFEDPQGLELLQSVIDRIMKSKLIDDVWELKKELLFRYLSPGKKVVKKGTFDGIEDLEIPEKELQDIDSFQDGLMFIKLNKAIVPVKGNKISWNDIGKAKKK